MSIGIYNQFKKEGIEIPFPQQDVYIKDFPNLNKEFIEEVDLAKEKKKKENLKSNKPEKKTPKQPVKPTVADQTDDGLPDDGEKQN